MADSNALKIIKLTSENIKRLSAVEITPDGAPVIVVAGENEAGKSSVLDSIAYALGGKELLPAKPIRDGQTRAEVMVDLGEYVVRRTFTAAGGSLVVMNRDGARFPSPQALLNGLVGKLSFDPLAFATMDAPKQAATLRALARIDTSDNELARKTAYDERTLVNRDIKTLEGQLAGLPMHADAPGAPESTDALTTQLEAADGLADAAARAERVVAEAQGQALATREKLARVRALIAQLEAQLEAAQAEEETADMAATLAEDKVAGLELARDRAAAQVPDRSVLRQQIGVVAERNRKAAENARRTDVERQLAEKRAVVESLTRKIDGLDQQKVDALASARFPVEGLGLDDHGVTWRGLPFEQASTSIRIRASVAIGLALNPKLKVLLIRNGNDLGPKNLQAVAEMAAAAGAQVWIERIAGGDGQATVVIEDGAVAEVSR